MNHTTFNTSQELNKYLPIITERFVYEDNTYNYLPLPLCNMQFYPAPTLEELLRVCPIWISIDTYLSYPENYAIVGRLPDREIHLFEYYKI